MTRVVFNTLGLGREPISETVRETAAEIIEGEKSEIYAGASKWIDLTPIDKGNRHGYNCGFIRSIIHPDDEPKRDDAWMDAGRSAIWAFQALQEATTIGQQAHAYDDLHNAMSDLSSFFPEFDYEVGMDSIGGEV